MLAVVKKPPIEFTVQGEIPDKYLKLLKKDFGPALSVFEDGESNNIILFYCGTKIQFN